MADTCEVQAIDNITSEIIESHIKVILTTHCIKAQIFLINKLKKKAEHNREICNFISSTNYKLQSEINQAHLDISSLLIAEDAIRMANIELKKDLFIITERKIDVIEKVKNGERKCEYLWIESKARYESLHFVQKLLKAQEELQRLQKIMTELEKEEKRYIEEIQVKKNNCINLDRKRVIELADFMVNVKPQTLAILKKNAVAIGELRNDVEKLNQKFKTNVVKEISTDQETNVALKTTNDSAMKIMPKLQLMGSLDLNVVNEQLDEVLIKKADSFNKTPVKNNINYSFKCTINIHNNDITEEYISSYFNKPSAFYGEPKPQNYSNKKFIHILDNVGINKSTAQKIMEKVNPETLQPVDSISAGNIKTKETSHGLKFKGKEPIESDEIEEIDLTGSNADILLIPPTQFLDKSLEMQGSQKEQEDASALMSAPEDKLSLPQGLKEELNKKKVSFDLPSTLETNVLAEIPETPGEIDANETFNSQLNFSAVSDASDGFEKIKDMIMKKHKLDLSPKFVYAKNITTPSAVPILGEPVVTSKFFQQDQIISNESEVEKKDITETNQAIEVVNIDDNPNKPENKIVEDNEPIVEIDVEADTGSKPKKRKINEQPDKLESGFLFNQTAQMTFESLDDSMNTGFEDGDTEFPHCIDSSLLLSPKADLPPLTLTGESTEVQSQDVPNFLSGIRKTGFSLFGCASTSEPKPDAQKPGGSHFSFNFGGEEKKSRGGLFSMFQ